MSPSTCLRGQQPHVVVVVVVVVVVIRLCLREKRCSSRTNRSSHLLAP